jgi:hypothetical protein
MLCRLRAVRFELDLFLKIQKVADQDIDTPIYLILWSLGRIDKAIYKPYIRPTLTYVQRNTR